MDALLKSLFAACEESKASDIHLATGLAPRFRVSGSLMELGDYSPFDAKSVDAVAMDLGLTTLPLGTPDGTEKVRYTLVKEGSLDGATASTCSARWARRPLRSAGLTRSSAPSSSSGFRAG